MTKILERRGGFTLIELMISVAIIGVLVSTAIPSFRLYQLRSKRSEAYANLGAIARTQTTFFTEAGIYWSALPMPGPVPTRLKRVWSPAAEAAYAGLGWIPEGNVFFDYETNTSCACNGCYTATAYGELDGDAAVSAILYVHPDPAGLSCPAGVTGDIVPVDSSGTPLFDQPVVSPASDDF